MSQDTRADFIRNALEQRAVVTHLNERMEQYEDDPTMLAYLQYQRNSLGMMLDECESLTPSLRNHNVHLGALAPELGDSANLAKGPTHTVYVQGRAVQYTDQLIEYEHQESNMFSARNLTAVTELVKILGANATLAECQEHFTALLMTPEINQQPAAENQEALEDDDQL